LLAGKKLPEIQGELKALLADAKQRKTAKPNLHRLLSDNESWESKNSEVEARLTYLNEREKAIIRLYFGCDDGTSKNLAEIGKRLDLTRERIRQIFRTAVQKMRGGDS
jgi:RNA polymerase sigma factor (sigma-70 family)